MPSDPTEGVTLIVRAEKAEAEVARMQRTLAEHVDENLSLHRRVAELEASLSNLVTQSEGRVAELEANQARLVSECRSLRERLKDASKLTDELAALRARVASAVEHASHVGHDEKRALALVLRTLRPQEST